MIGYLLCIGYTKLDHIIFIQKHHCKNLRSCCAIFASSDGNRVALCYINQAGFVCLS